MHLFNIYTWKDCIKWCARHQMMRETSCTSVMARMKDAAAYCDNAMRITMRFDSHWCTWMMIVVMAQRWSLMRIHDDWCDNAPQWWLMYRRIIDDWGNKRRFCCCASIIIHVIHQWRLIHMIDACASIVTDAHYHMNHHWGTLSHESSLMCINEYWPALSRCLSAFWVCCLWRHVWLSQRQSCIILIVTINREIEIRFPVGPLSSLVFLQIFLGQ